MYLIQYWGENRHFVIKKREFELVIIIYTRGSLTIAVCLWDLAAQKWKNQNMVLCYCSCSVQTFFTRCCTPLYGFTIIIQTTLNIQKGSSVPFHFPLLHFTLFSHDAFLLNHWHPSASPSTATHRGWPHTSEQNASRFSGPHVQILFLVFAWYQQSKLILSNACKILYKGKSRLSIQCLHWPLCCHTSWQLPPRPPPNSLPFPECTECAPIPFHKK